MRTKRIYCNYRLPQVLTFILGTKIRNFLFVHLTYNSSHVSDFDRIYSSQENHPGYGAGSGDTERYEYLCPCGKGKVVEEHDNIPGDQRLSL